MISIIKNSFLFLWEISLEAFTWFEILVSIVMFPIFLVFVAIPICLPIFLLLLSSGCLFTLYDWQHDNICKLINSCKQLCSRIKTYIKSAFKNSLKQAREFVDVLKKELLGCNLFGKIIFFPIWILLMIAIYVIFWPFMFIVFLGFKEG